MGIGARCVSTVDGCGDVGNVGVLAERELQRLEPVAQRSRVMVAEFRRGGVDEAGEDMDEDAGVRQVPRVVPALVESQLHSSGGHEVDRVETEDLARLQGGEVPGGRHLLNWGFVLHAVRLPPDLGNREIGFRRTSGGRSHLAADSCKVQVQSGSGCCAGNAVRLICPVACARRGSCICGGISRGQPLESGPPARNPVIHLRLKLSQ